MSEDIGLHQLCFVNNSGDSNRYVGLVIENNSVKIFFPLGYRLSKYERDLRKDIINLFKVLNKFSKETKSYSNSNVEIINNGFPIDAYSYIINDYLENGYYFNKDIIYSDAFSGNIDWKRTIQRQSVLIQSDFSPVYTTYTIRKHKNDYANKISIIHQYCVFESFKSIGWLYTEYKPEKPCEPPKFAEYISILRENIKYENNDSKIRLFQSMIEILNFNSHTPNRNMVKYGVDYFEAVWEKMIDEIYGLNNKRDYFPRAEWILDYNDNKAKRALEPDTIMKYQDSFLIIDAKYYRYGVTGNPNDLPNSSSINKQITYGEYVYRNKIMKENKLYNLFIIPFNSKENHFSITDNIGKIGYAKSDWKSNQNQFERVLGVVIDTKFLMSKFLSSDNELMKELLIDKVKSY